MRAVVAGSIARSSLSSFVPPKTQSFVRGMAYMSGASSHAIAYTERLARELGSSKTILVNLSGRGDKDVQTVEKTIAGRHAGRI